MESSSSGARFGVRFDWRRVAALAACSLLPVMAFAATAGDATEPADARAWLARIHTAASQGNYQGTLVYSAAGVLSSSRIAHFCVGEQSYERVEALDGLQQRVYRVNDAVHTLWPQQRVAVVEKRSPLSGLPSATQTVEPRALEQYALLREGSERIAGRESQVFLLQPRDEWRYAQRVWADKATGLMLRADIVAGTGAVLESAAFSQVDVGVRPQPETVTQALKKLDGYRVMRPQQQLAQLEAEGWAVDRPVAGFKLAGCIKRPLDAGGDAQVLQAVFSDGLTHVSLFIEPIDARRPLAPVAGQLGATSTLREQHAEHWITVMGDVPVATLKAFADALERRR